MNKFSDQVTKLTNILTTINAMANQTDALPKYATVVSSDLIQIDGSDTPTPFSSNEENGTRIKIKIENHEVVRVDEKSVIENSYDDTDIKSAILDVKETLVDINQRSEDNSSDAEDLFDRLTEYLNTLASGLEEQDDIDDEVGELLDETINDLQDDLTGIEDLVEAIKTTSEEASGLAKEAYDAVYPITSEMRDSLGELFKLADMDTAQTEEINGVYEREGEYSQSKAEYQYNQTKSASAWSQTISAELNAWAKNDPATQNKITEAQNELTSANDSLSSAQKSEIEVEERHKSMVKKYNAAYKVYLKAQTEGNTDKINKAKNLVDAASNDIYGTGLSKESFVKAEEAISALEATVKRDTASTETCSNEIAQARAELSKFSDNDGSLYALLKARFDTAVAEAEVGTAVNGIHKICSSTIQQKADEILEAVTEETVDGMIKQAAVSIKSDSVDTTIRTLKSDGSLAKGTLIHEYNGGSLVCRIGNEIGCLANANGSFDIVRVSWTSTTDSYGNTVYTPSVLNNALSRFDQNGTSFSNGITFGSSGTDGIFYVGGTVSKKIRIAAGNNMGQINFSYSDLIGSKSGTVHDYLYNNLFRPLAPVRLMTNHSSMVKITGWDYNPGRIKNDDATSLSVKISRQGANNKSSLSVTVYVQTAWVRANIDQVDSGDIPVDEDGESSGGSSFDSTGYLKGSLDGTNKTLTITIM